MNARRVLLAGAVVAFGGALAGLQGTRAAFVGTTANTGNSLAAAASFPDYPSAVVADDPLFYHRLDDAAGSVTAADASGHGLPGVYGTTNASGWNGLWPMDDASGTTATDKAAATTVHDLVLHGTSGFTRKYIGTAQFSYPTRA